MESGFAYPFLAFLFALLAVVSSAQDFDFFYFVQQWPGSLCNTKQSCCYPSTGKPASDFGIHGLWPNNDDGSYPSNCDPDSPFIFSKISDLTSQMQRSWPSLGCPSSNSSNFWSHEWAKHGTCSESVLDQHGYFQAALNLKDQVDIRQILLEAGIKPDGRRYSVDSIGWAIAGVTGFKPGIACNVDESGNSQLYQIFICADPSGSSITECPILPRGRCSSHVKFPSF